MSARAEVLPGAPTSLPGSKVAVEPVLVLPARSAGPEVKIQQTLDAIEDAIARRADRCFAVLMVVQWLCAMTMAVWVTPRTWIGAVSTVGPYVAMAVIGGGIISLTPAALVWLSPGTRMTRHVIALGQMLMSSLLIHLAGGQIEMHFHIFGSLAFLACYVDWTVLLTASSVVVLDHSISNFFWPQAIFGTGQVQSWRWLEHGGWVVFCDVFLIASSIGRRRNLRMLARQTVDQQWLLQQAYTDALTGLPNRLKFQKEIEAAMARSKQTGVGFDLMYVDLDRFKEVNDRHGHATGDRVLLAVAGRLKGTGGETAFARIGGDEFVAICPRSDGEKGTGDRAREVLTSMLLPIKADGLSLTVGASIGVSRYPEDGVDEDELLHRADLAMYTVKRQGRRGFCFFDASMDSPLEGKERGEAEARLLVALERDELSVHYQPLVSVDGALEGLEALVRWVQPNGKSIPPCDFIPLAEQTGLIVRLGQVVIEKVCKQLAEWHARGVEFGHVAVNLSPKQLEAGNFFALLDENMAGHGIKPEWIAFEITESACALDDRVLQANLEALRERGIRVLLDDFGTGYSSFGRLQELSFNTLKIDQIFISRLGQPGAGYGVVEGIIGLAHLMGMTVVAEGVENEAQWELLRQMNCDMLQGYHFSRPLAAPGIEAFIARLSREQRLTALRLGGGGDSLAATGKDPDLSGERRAGLPRVMPRAAAEATAIAAAGVIDAVVAAVATQDLLAANGGTQQSGAAMQG